MMRVRRGVSGEVDAEEVKDFAFVEVGGGPGRM